MDDIKVVPKDYESSHKFGHSPLAEALWVCSMDSGQNEEAGTVDDIGWHGLFHFEQAEEVTIVGGAYDSDSPPDAVVTVPRGSYILMTDSVGFVYAERYGFKDAEVSEEWRKIVAAEDDLWDEYDGLDYDESETRPGDGDPIELSPESERW